VRWFRVSRGRLEYRGRITREPFMRWTETKEGTAAVTRVAAGIRFSLFGRARAARRRIWRALEEASRRESLVAAIRMEAAHYMEVLAGLSYSDTLPRVHIALHRLVLVPRALIAGRARTALFARLSAAPALVDVDDSARIFLLEQLVKEMDAALQIGEPSPRRPVHAHDEWACVGVSKGLVWVDPLWTGADGTGHVFMCEFPRAGLSRRDRKAVEAAITGMAANVSSLSVRQRIDMVRA
jgi:hypothetical protein